jgi:hypothetical protein
MKNALKVAAALLLCTPYAAPQDLPHRHWHKVFSVLPTKTLNIRNKWAHTVEIRSDYPIQIAAGECHTEYTVQFTCTFDDPADLFIRDLRQWPVFAQPRSNSITVDAKED